LLLMPLTVPDLFLDNGDALRQLINLRHAAPTSSDVFRVHLFRLTHLLFQLPYSSLRKHMRGQL